MTQRFFKFLVLILITTTTCQGFFNERAVSDDKYWYITFPSSHTLHIFDKKTGEEIPCTIFLRPVPSPMKICGDKGYITYREGTSIDVIDLITHTRLEPIKLKYPLQDLQIHGNIALISMYDLGKKIHVYWLLNLHSGKIILDLEQNNPCDFIFKDAHVYILKSHPKYFSLYRFDLMTETMELIKEQHHGSTQRQYAIIQGNTAYFYGKKLTTLYPLDLTTKTFKTGLKLEHSFEHVVQYGSYGVAFETHEKKLTLLNLDSGTIVKIFYDLDSIFDLQFYKDFVLIKDSDGITRINLKSIDLRKHKLIFDQNFATQHILRNSILYAVNTKYGKVSVIDLDSKYFAVKPIKLTIPSGDYTVGFTGTEAYGFACENPGVSHLVSLLDKPRDRLEYTQLNIKNPDLVSAINSVVSPDAALDTLLDPDWEKAAFWKIISYMELQSSYDASVALCSALEAQNPYAYAMMYLAYTHGLWGAPCIPLLGKMYFKEADKKLIKTFQHP